MDLDHFIEHFSRDENLALQIGLYIIRPINLIPRFQNKQYCRCGIGGSREVANIDRSVTASGAESKGANLFSRMAMYHRNWIAGGEIIAMLVLPRSVINSPSGPTITRILQNTNPDDRRPAYALKGVTQARALEMVYHQNLDQMPKVKRARTKLVEWFETTQSNFENIKLSLRAVGHGTYYDLTKFKKNTMPQHLVGKGVKLSGGQVLETTTHAFRKSPRLMELAEQEVVEEDGTVKLTLDDIEDIRSGTERGNYLLELITRKPKTSTSSGTQTGPNVATRSRRTQTIEPVTVRLTRSTVRRLREANEGPDATRMRRLARALAELA
jgi:hypothetical protein